MTTESLKEGARKHEQNEEWIKALELYLQAIQERAEGEEPDIALHNRVGDLQVRMGDVEGAVASYETAIQLYLEADLLNNAIAICRKIIRNSPNRPSPFLRMGQIRARQGFVVDARQNFITYAEMMEARGKTDEALSALEECVSLSPKDVDTRLFLAEHLVSEDRQDDALRYFTQAYRLAVESGNHFRGEEILIRVREVAPDAPQLTLSDEVLTLPDDEETPESPHHLREEEGDDNETEEEELAGFETTSMETYDAGSRETAPPPQASGFEFSDISLGSATLREAEDEPVETGSSMALDRGDLDGDDDREVGASIGGEADEDDTPLPMIDFGSLDEDLAEDDEVPVPLPFLEDFSADFEQNENDLPEFESESEFTQTSEFEYLSDGRQASEDEDDEDEEAVALPLFDTAPLDPLIALYRHVQLNPRDVDGWQRILEQAHPAGDKGLLALAYLGLASALSDAGEDTRARDAYRQLLAVDPENPEALAALGEFAAEPTTESGAPVVRAPPASDGYVDLGAMILGDSGEGTTRWVVSATAPSGDESADFSRLLSQFKEQVSQNLSVEDAEAHYDLGTAYKEMGLLDEAISEFQLALRAQPKNLATFEMLGQCFLDRGEAAAAVRTLERALLVPSQVEDDLLGIYYFLAKSQEVVGNPTAAKDFYERIFALDINFKDVTERLRNLR